MKQMKSLKRQGGWIDTALSFGSALISKSGSDDAADALRDQAELAEQRGREQQVYNEVAAQQIMAIGYANAQEETRQAELVASRAVAVAAAGGSVSDIDYLIADIYGEGKYRAGVALMGAQYESERLLFEGEQAAKYGLDVASSLEGQAEAQEMSGWTALLDTTSALYGGFNFGDTTTTYTSPGNPHAGGY